MAHRASIVHRKKQTESIMKNLLLILALCTTTASAQNFVSPRINSPRPSLSSVGGGSGARDPIKVANGQCWAVKNGKMLPMTIELAKKYDAVIFLTRREAEEFMERKYGHKRSKGLQSSHGLTRSRGL